MSESKTEKETPSSQNNAMAKASAAAPLKNSSSGSTRSFNAGGTNHAMGKAMTPPIHMPMSCIKPKMIRVYAIAPFMGDYI